MSGQPLRLIYLLLLPVLSAFVVLNTAAQTNDQTRLKTGDSKSDSRADTNSPAALSTNMVSIGISGMGIRDFNTGGTLSIPEPHGKETTITSLGNGSFVIREPGAGNRTYIKALNNGGMVIRGPDNRSILVTPTGHNSVRINRGTRALFVTSNRDGTITIWSRGRSGRTYTIPMPEPKKR